MHLLNFRALRASDYISDFKSWSGMGYATKKVLKSGCKICDFLLTVDRVVECKFAP